MNAALTMVMLGAAGETRDEMLDVLGYDTDDACMISNAYEEELNRYNSMTDSTVEIANSIWVDNDAELNSDYSDKLEASFDAEVQDIDLQSDNAVKDY